MSSGCTLCACLPEKAMLIQTKVQIQAFFPFLKKSVVLAGQWWHMPLMPALGRQGQADFLIRGQPDLQSKFQNSQGYTEKPCLKKPNIFAKYIDL